MPPADHYGDGRDREGAVSFKSVRCIRESAKAILCVGPTGKERWIPSSVVHDDSEVYRLNDKGTLVVKRWWAEREGLAKPMV